MKAWTVFKAGIAAAITLTMAWHWSVAETYAEPPAAIIATGGTGAPAENILHAERIPDGRWVDYGTFKTTGYCNCRKCCGKWSGGPTKSGAMPVEGVTIATDWKVIPGGTKVLINGNVYTVQDTGVKGKHIDIYYADHDRASDHGVKRQQVFVWVEYPITDGAVVNDLRKGEK